MNTVKGFKNETGLGITTLGEITRNNFHNLRTAFIGNIGNYVYELFLVNYDSIMLARDPSCTWSFERRIDISIERWVDITITID